MKKIEFRVRLLPTYFKKVGIVILISTVFFFFLHLINIITVDKSLLISITKTGVLISLLILAMSKEKVEDELTSHIRLMALALSFTGGAVIVIFEPLMPLLFGDNIGLFKNSFFIIFFMFTFYFYIYKSLLKKR